MSGARVHMCWRGGHLLAQVGLGEEGLECQGAYSAGKKKNVLEGLTRKVGDWHDPGSVLENQSGISV